MLHSSRVAAALLLVMLVAPTLVIGTASPPTIRLEIFMLGSPPTNTTYIEERASLDQPVSGVIELPVVVPAKDVAVIDAEAETASGGAIKLNATYDDALGSIIVYGENVTAITIKAIAYGSYTSEAIGAYSIIVDLSKVREDTQITCTFVFSRAYTPMIISSGGYSVERNLTENTISISLRDKELYMITLLANIPTSVPGETSATTINSQPNNPLPSLLPPIIGAIAGATAITVALYLLKRRRRSVIVEEIASNDILLDDVIRGIIRAIGDAGKEGIVQAKLPSILGKPKSTISRKIKRLSEEGYVTVIRKGKINVLKLTEKGWEAYRRIKKGVKSG